MNVQREWVAGRAFEHERNSEKEVEVRGLLKLDGKPKPRWLRTVQVAKLVCSAPREHSASNQASVFDPLAINA